jgi:NitT/TauT family transport system permease protein
MLSAFRPNTSLTTRAWLTVLAIEAALLLTVWSMGGAVLVPGPVDTVKALGQLVTQDGLLYELLVSMKVNAEAIALSTAISLALSYLTVLPVMRPFVEFCSKGRFFSLAGWMVVFTMAFGGGHGLKVALLTFGMSVFFVTSMSAVVAAIPRQDWDQARSLRMGEWRMVWEVVVLGKADEAFEVLRQNAAIGWMMLTMVEGLVRSEGGVGALMLNENKHFRLAAVFAVQLVVLLVGIFQDQAIGYIKNVCCPYARLSLERR